MANILRGLLFISDTTKAVYFWNGEKVIRVVSDNKLRRIGKTVKGIPSKKIELAYIFGADGFWEGNAHYTIINRTDVDVDALISVPKKRPHINR